MATAASPCDQGNLLDECFDLDPTNTPDVNGTDDADGSDSNQVVDSNNANAWTESDNPTSGSDCRIRREELQVRDGCVVTYGPIDATGFTALELAYLYGWSNDGDDSQTAYVEWSTDGTSFEEITNYALPNSTSTCDSAGTEYNCADTSASFELPVETCGTSSLYIRFSTPNTEGDNGHRFVIDDVSVSGTAGSCNPEGECDQGNLLDECFDLDPTNAPDTNGTDDADGSDSNQVVDSNNANAWTENDTVDSPSDCRIRREELQVRDECVVTYGPLDATGFTALELAYLYGWSTDGSGSQTAYVQWSTDGTTFTDITNYPLPNSTSTCDSAGTEYNCADTAASFELPEATCGTSSLYIRFTTPTGEGDNGHRFVVDDVRVSGTAGTCSVPTATLYIQKECEIGDTATDFSMALDGPDAPTIAPLDCGETSTALTIAADEEYTLSETVPTGYQEPSIRGACDGDGTVTLAEGATGTCVVHNTKLAYLLISKECEDGDTASNFTIDLTGPGSYGDQTATLDCGETTSVALTVEANREYTVSETAPTGYQEPSIRGACDGDGTVTLAPGATGTCVVHNTKLAYLLISKECDDGDTTTNFTIDLIGPGAYGDQSATLDCGETTATALTVEANREYTVSETVPSGYEAATFGDACDSDGTVTLMAGATVTCVVHNTLTDVDADNDGVTDELDMCPNTPDGEEVLTEPEGIAGCAPSQLAKVEVRKVLLPFYDDGEFDLLIDGTVYAEAVGNHGTTEFQYVLPGSVTVSEEGNGADLDDYFTKVACVDESSFFGPPQLALLLAFLPSRAIENWPGNPLIGSGHSSSLTVSVDAEQEVVCTFVNIRVPDNFHWDSLSWWR